MDGTPQQSSLVHILQMMVLIERDTSLGDAMWSVLEEVAGSIMALTTPQQAASVVSTGSYCVLYR